MSLVDARTPLLGAALAYAKLGWRVFPTAADKRPLTVHGHHDATTDEAVIRAWTWSGGIGWALPAGLFVLDVDARHRGHESLDELERQHARLPRTLSQVTGGGGLHLIFRVPTGREARQLVGLRDGIDTRTDRGYVVLPPSRHTSGLRYAWRDRTPIVEAPAWLADLVCWPARPAPKLYTPAEQTQIATSYAAAVLRGECAEMAATAEGGRNHRLFKAWKRLTCDGLPLDRDLVRRELTAAALTAGLAEREIERTLR